MPLLKTEFPLSPARRKPGPKDMRNAHSSQRGPFSFLGSVLTPHSHPSVKSQPYSSQREESILPHDVLHRPLFHSPVLYTASPVSTIPCLSPMPLEGAAHGMRTVFSICLAPNHAGLLDYLLCEQTTEQSLGSN